MIRGSEEVRKPTFSNRLTEEKMNLSNETLKDLSDALDRFDAEKLAEALDRNTEAAKALSQSIDRLLRAFELLGQSQSAQDQKSEN